MRSLHLTGEYRSLVKEAKKKKKEAFIYVTIVIFQEYGHMFEQFPQNKLIFIFKFNNLLSPPPRKGQFSG